MMRGALIIVITLTQQSSPVCIAMIFFFLWRGGEDSRVLHILLRLSGPPDCLESYLIQPDRVYLVFFSAHFFIFFLFLYKRERERVWSNLICKFIMRWLFLLIFWSMGWDAKALFASRTPETVQTGEEKKTQGRFIFCARSIKKREKK